MEAQKKRRNENRKNMYVEHPTDSHDIFHLVGLVWLRESDSVRGCGKGVMSPWAVFAVKNVIYFVHNHCRLVRSVCTQVQEVDTNAFTISIIRSRVLGIADTFSWTRSIRTVIRSTIGWVMDPGTQDFGCLTGATAWRISVTRHSDSTHFYNKMLSTQNVSHFLSKYYFAFRSTSFNFYFRKNSYPCDANKCSSRTDRGVFVLSTIFKCFCSYTRINKLHYPIVFKEHIP